MKRSWPFLFLLVFLIPALSGQDSPADKKKKAKVLIANARFAEALPILTSTPELRLDDKESKFLIGVCYFQTNQLNQAEECLQNLIRQERSVYPETWLYLARIAHHQNQFQKAVEYYKSYLKTMDGNSTKRQMVWDAVRRCSNGLALQYRTAKAFVENLGPEINTPNDEFGPVPSPNFEEKLYFSSIRKGNMGGPRNAQGLPDETLGQYFSDIFSCRRINGQWRDAQRLHYLLNSPRHEVILDFNASGSALFFFQGADLSTGQIMVDSFQQEGEIVFQSNPFWSPLEGSANNQSPHIVNETLVIFPSQQPGGYGGLDLYRSSFTNGKWSEPENLGPEINSSYDETTPFLARDGRTLYFSTNDPKRSIGGSDVVKSVYNERSNRWTVVENIGLPVNSAGDDTHFRLNKDGYTAFFASSRKDGYGQRDLYIAYFNEYLEEQELPWTETGEEAEEELAASPVSSPPEPSPPLPPASNRVPYEKQEPVQPVSTPEVTPEALLIGPLFFNDDNSLLEGKNKEILDKLAVLLKRDHALSLIITASSQQKSGLVYRLQSAIRSGEKAAIYLIRNGVDPNLIFVRAVGSPSYTARSEWAKSLGFSLLSIKKTPGNEPSGSTLPPGLDDNPPLVYKVQIAASKQGDYKGEALNIYPGPMVEKSPVADYFRYTVGTFDRFQAADQFRRELIRSGHSGAFVVPYLYGWRADAALARQYAGEMPDLRQFLGKI